MRTFEKRWCTLLAASPAARIALVGDDLLVPDLADAFDAHGLHELLPEELRPRHFVGAERRLGRVGVDQRREPRRGDRFLQFGAVGDPLDAHSLGDPPWPLQELPTQPSPLVRAKRLVGQGDPLAVGRPLDRGLESAAVRLDPADHVHECGHRVRVHLQRAEVRGPAGRLNLTEPGDRKSLIGLCERGLLAARYAPAPVLQPREAGDLVTPACPVYLDWAARLGEGLRRHHADHSRARGFVQGFVHPGGNHPFSQRSNQGSTPLSCIDDLVFADFQLVPGVVGTIVGSLRAPFA